MKQYLKLLGDIMTKGYDDVLANPNIGEVRQVISSQLRFDLAKGYPLLTTRPQDFAKLRDEGLDFMHNSNAQAVVTSLTTLAEDRLFTVRDLENPGPPVRCQIVNEGYSIHCILTCDTVDVVSELPRIIALYALFVRLLAREAVGRHDGLLVVNIGRAIVKHSDFKLVNTQINRHPLKLCKLQYNPERASFKDSVPDDLSIADYIYHDEIEIPELDRIKEVLRKSGATVTVTNGTES